MRRTIATAGTFAVLAPLLLAGASSAAGASATGSLTVSVTGRDGSSADATLAGTQMYAVNRTTSLSYELDPGEPTTLPDGDYAVVAGIVTAADQSLTLTGKTVTVSGAARLSLDARGGEPVDLAFSPAAPDGDPDDVTQLAELCVTGAGTPGVVFRHRPGGVYVVPSSSSSFRTGYGLVSARADANGDGTYYLDAGDRAGIPAGVTATFPTSSLASVELHARSGLESEPRPYFDVHSASSDYCYATTTDLQFWATLPAHFELHLPAGNWNLLQEGVFGEPVPFTAGGSYDITMDHAVWGPSDDLPYTAPGSDRLHFGYTRMFTDPTFSDGGAPANTAWKLSEGSKTLYQATVGDGVDPSAVMPSAGWYTLYGVAHRATTPPAGTLSTTSTLSLHFYANPAAAEQVRDYVPRFWPLALDSGNRALPGSTTSVDLAMRRPGTGDPTAIAQLSDAVKSVALWYSADGGATWHAAAVTHSGSSWTGAVHNPASGRVALRATVTDTHGDSSTTTVYNAYAVS